MERIQFDGFGVMPVANSNIPILLQFHLYARMTQMCQCGLWNWLIALNSTDDYQNENEHRRK